ncbi:MAG: ring-cleaving dioxygenase [Gemmatimonadetes bacterium]|nr:ring-cleaving dioxygenase [Gemmatimonadota bacterium]
MGSVIRGLHHVTATVTGAQEDLDFFVKLLGLRLAKKTVNFDNHNVFHFYYGDGRGSPSTLMTTFPYQGWGVAVGTQGAGQVTTTSFSVPAGALDFWRRRLKDAAITVQDGASRFGEETLAFGDPSGLRIQLVAAGSDDRQPWTTDEIDATVAIRGLHSASLSVWNPEPSLDFLTDVLGFEVVNEAGSATRVGIGGDLPGRVFEIVHAPDAPRAINGLGTVHHVAMAIDDADEQLRIRAELVRAGRQVTEVRDRQYFKSIYFREPGGVLYEIATLGPGFLIDEEFDRLGTDLRLPPWEEPHRRAIEAALPRVSL